MKIKIYQINSKRDEDRVSFMDLEGLKRFQKMDGVNSEIYDMKYEGVVDTRSLDGIYRVFNINRPNDFKGHSLSVSDVVEVVEDDTVKPGFYFCDSYGFKKIDFDESSCHNVERDNCSNNKITVVLVKAGFTPEIVEIESSLNNMQTIVGGSIEAVYPFDDEVALVCNEEGKISGLPLNRAIFGEDKAIQDIIAGDFFVCYAPASSEKFESLPTELLHKYMEMFKCPEKFFRRDNEIVAIPLHGNNTSKI